MKKVLIIEDDKDLTETLKDILATEHFEVVWAPTGQKGIERAALDHPDLIILDLSLRDMNGVNVCKALKADQSTSRIPILVYTGHMGPGVAQDAIKAGGDLYVGKSTRPEKIVKIVKELSGQS